MILILSDTSDVTTYHVARWLEYLGKEVCIITDEDRVEVVTITHDDLVLKLDDQTIDLKNISAYWYRRGDIVLATEPALLNYPTDVRSELKKETASIIGIIYRRLAGCRCLGTIWNADVNRVLTMDMAKEEGLTIPDYCICSSKTTLTAFREKHTQIVTKPVWNGLSCFEDNILYTNHTHLFTDDDFAALPEIFYPSYFVSYVEKKYELRIFYLDGQCHTMAILSQNDEQTKIDFRHYNTQKPNRNLPYLLPKNVEAKIDQLMKRLRLKTGSIDMIVTNADEFIFLEVNPVGQFLNLSHTCNYNLEKNVASYLAG